MTNDLDARRVLAMLAPRRPCWNCQRIAVVRAFPDADFVRSPHALGGFLSACAECVPAVRASARLSRTISRALNRRARGHVRLREFRARAKARRALARFITMHAACAALGGVR